MKRKAFLLILAIGLASCSQQPPKIILQGLAQGSYYAITYFDEQNRNFQSDIDSIFHALYVMLHKPVDFECSHHPRDHRSVYELLPDRFSAMGIQSAGRLDADSSGIILFSNQGDFIHKVESPKKGCLKRYRVTLAREFTEAQEKELLAGVMLKDERRPVLAREIVREEGSVVITIGEGLYHQVRRMFAAVGNHVETLERISIGPVVLDESLGEGGWRFLTDEEVASL